MSGFSVVLAALGAGPGCARIVADERLSAGVSAREAVARDGMHSTASPDAPPAGSG